MGSAAVRLIEVLLSIIYLHDSKVVPVVLSFHHFPSHSGLLPPSPKEKEKKMCGLAISVTIVSLSSEHSGGGEHKGGMNIDYGG